jgi:DNA-directed RNA polymerase subunit RPC12/RpoP
VDSVAAGAGPDDQDAILACPWCGARHVEMVGPFGSHLMVAQYICLACHSPFERIRKGW